MDQKARQFVRHLLANPSLKAYAPLQKEEQIISFLRINAGRLYPTLSSPDFFPGQSWNQIYKLLMQALYASTSESVVSGLKEFFSQTINFHFLSFFSRPTGRSDDRETRLFSFMMKLIAHPLARKALTGPYSAIQLHLAHRYLDLIYDGRGYIRFELEKVQRLAMSQEEVKNLIRTSLLLRPAVFLFQVARLPGQHEIAGLIPFQFAQKVIQALEKELPFLPSELLESAVYSNVSFGERNDIPATARLSALFSMLACDFHPGLKIDRGAVGQERSWFGIARRNHRLFGYDVKMTDELYRLAAENGW
jgi:hypothetical protein